MDWIDVGSLAQDSDRAMRYQDPMSSRSRWVTVGIAAFWVVVAVLAVIGIVLIVLTASGTFSIE